MEQEKVNQEISFIDQSFLGKKSIFYVGGKYSGKEDSHYLCNQMFVEAYVPREVLHPYPVILFHGAGQTNVNWLITPDGRMGWADYFLSKGYMVYLAEQPARGRSAYHPDENGKTIYHSIEMIQSQFTTDQGDWPQAAGHTQWPGDGGDLEDPVFRQFASSQVEFIFPHKASQKLVLDAGKELLKKTGPAILLTHSQAGPFGWLLADACPDLVKGIVTVEPFGPPFTRDLSSTVAKNYGIAGFPLCYDPPVNALEQLKLRILKAKKPGLKDGWVFQEPAPQLPHLKGKPILFLVGEASYHAGYDHLTSYVLRQCGVEHDFIRLEDVGIHGNGHMMMLEKNSLEIAAWIVNWLDKHI